jgi:hypothetical protein
VRMCREGQLGGKEWDQHLSSLFYALAHMKVLGSWSEILPESCEVCAIPLKCQQCVCVYVCMYVCIGGGVPVSRTVGHGRFIEWETVSGRFCNVCPTHSYQAADLGLQLRQSNFRTLIPNHWMIMLSLFLKGSWGWAFSRCH